VLPPARPGELCRCVIEPFQGEAMGLGLNPSETPELYHEKHQPPLPVESLQGTDKTAYLLINLKVDPMGEKPVAPMTAVFAPDPSKLTGTVDVILWLHGDKSYWNKKHTDERDFRGKSIQHYLTLPLCQFREFILQSRKRKFILVAPTLNDHTGSRLGLNWDHADAAAYLQQCLNGVKEHMGANATQVGNIVLAAHSGGGHLQAIMADHFTGKFDKMNEIWCFDSTYWGSKSLIKWAQKGHSHARLWVYSTGGTTGRYAAQILKFAESPPPEELKHAPPAKPKHHGKKHSGVAVKIEELVHSAEAVRMKIEDEFHGVKVAASHLWTALFNPPTNIEVLIHGAGKHGAPLTTDGFVATYGGSAVGHYEGMPQYLPTLVETSQNLK
jgi:hypothetical protein